MSATCIITNCRKTAPAGEPFCSDHRGSTADKLKDRAIIAAEYRLHCSPHEWTDDDSEAMALYITALHGSAISRMPREVPQTSLAPDKRPCTCHSDDRPSGECRERYAVSECDAQVDQSPSGSRPERA